MDRAHVFVEGKVQGVTFRDSTRQEAEKRQVDGWVRNRSDGRVEAVFQGPQPQISRMIDYVHQGPDQAQVEGVEVEWEEGTDEELAGNGFQVRPTD